MELVTKEQPCNGVYRIAPDGKVTLLIDDLTFPNGIAFTQMAAHSMSVCQIQKLLASWPTLYKQIRAA